VSAGIVAFLSAAFCSAAAFSLFDSGFFLGGSLFCSGLFLRGCLLSRSFYSAAVSAGVVAFPSAAFCF
jgi:hypothetical protein